MGARLRRHPADPARVGPLLRDAGFVGSEVDPTKCHALFDAAGQPRRITAHYPDGWRCRMILRRDGPYSLSQSITLEMRRPTK